MIRRRPPAQRESFPKLTMMSLLVLAVVCVLPARARTLEPRELRPLSDSQIRGLAALDPPLWDAVDSGHMEHLLVERVCGLL